MRIHGIYYTHITHLILLTLRHILLCFGSVFLQQLAEIFTFQLMELTVEASHMGRSNDPTLGRMMNS